MTTPGGPPVVPPAPAGLRGAGGAKSPTKAVADPIVTAEDIESLRDLAHGLSYAGFDTARIRGLVREKVPAKDLLKVLVAASLVGNAPERLNGKVTDPVIGRETLSMLTRYGIKSKGAVGANDLTLARVAAACAPLFFQVRKLIVDELQDQGLNTGLDKVLQSPSLAVYADLNPAMTPWLVAFGRQIKPKAEVVEITDMRTVQFKDIAVGNRSRDKFLHPDNLSKSVAELVAMMYA